MNEYVWHESGKRRTTPEYRAWQNMKNRCLNPKTHDFKYYGGRGITICRRWITSFGAFLSDMGTKPSIAHTLERKYTDGAYCKQNCIWATRQHQAQNRNYCRLTLKKAQQIRIEYARGIGDQTDLAKKFKVSQRTISLIARGESWKNAGGPVVKNSKQYRNTRGILNPRAKLTVSKVAKLRKMYASKRWTQAELAQKFGLKQPSVSKILLGISYAEE